MLFISNFYFCATKKTDFILSVFKSSLKFKVLCGKISSHLRNWNLKIRINETVRKLQLSNYYHYCNKVCVNALLNFVADLNSYNTEGFSFDNKLEFLNSDWYWYRNMIISAFFQGINYNLFVGFINGCSIHKKDIKLIIFNHFDNVLYAFITHKSMNINELRILNPMVHNLVLSTSMSKRLFSFELYWTLSRIILWTDLIQFIFHNLILSYW